MQYNPVMWAGLISTDIEVYWWSNIIWQFLQECFINKHIPMLISSHRERCSTNFFIHSTMMDIVLIASNKPKSTTKGLRVVTAAYTLHHRNPGQKVVQLQQFFFYCTWESRFYFCRESPVLSTDFFARMSTWTLKVNLSSIQKPKFLQCETLSIAKPCKVLIWILV